jgi:NTP pyrophosphatase (non-canonical NTP hydrolase)
MNTEEELFTVTGEECAELIMAMSKITRFGLSPESEDNLKQELGDVACMLALFIEHGYITEEELTLCADQKMEKLKKWSSLIPDEYL